MQQVSQTDSLSPRLIRTEVGQYTRQEWPGKNTSGYRPLGDLVLVLIDACARKTGGGIELPPDVVDRMDLAAETGVVAAHGEGAWKWSADRRRPFGGPPPVVGDRVYIERYAGQLVNGDDGLKYRLVPDRQIGALRE